MNTKTDNSSLKKILFLHGSSDMYGASKILLYIISELKHRYECHVCLTESGPLSGELELLGCTVHYMDLGILRRKYFTPWGLINRILMIIISLFKLRSLVKNHGINIIYSNTLSVLNGFLYSSIYKIKNVWHIHEIILSPKFFASNIARFIESNNGPVIAVSGPVKEYWNTLLRNKEKIQVIQNGIPVPVPSAIGVAGYKSRLKPEEGNVLVGMIARVNPWKGQKYFIEIASIISKSMPQCRFVMAGDAFPGNEYLYEELRELIDSFGLTNITDVGYCDTPYDYIASLDLLVLPSILPDPFPTVILEAFHTGVCVAATRHGGATEMIEDGATGLLIPFDDAQLAAGKIMTVLREKEHLEFLAQNAKAKASTHYTIEKYAQKIDGAIAGAL